MLLRPSFQDYKDSAKEIGNWFVSNQVDYIIYWSFNNPKKLRPGLSDIDIFAHKETPALLFPIEITRAFWEIRSRVECIWIPLQINWTTSGQFQSPVFDVEAMYMSEVQRAISSPYKSGWIEKILNTPRATDPFDDQHMLRFFRRKINDMGGHLYKVEQVLLKSQKDFDIHDQKALWSLWDEFKKGISIIALAIRIKTDESIFSLNDAEILSYFQNIFPHHTDYSEYLRLLKTIKDINDWHEYLQKPENRDSLVRIYETVLNLAIWVISESGIKRNS